MDDSLRGRRRLVAGAAAATGVLFVAAVALLPDGTDEHITTLEAGMKEVLVARAHQGQLLAASLLILIGMGGLAVTFAGLTGLVREKSSTLATVAGTLGVIASFCGAIINVLANSIVVAAAKADLTVSAAAAFLVSAQRESGVSLPFGPLYLLGLPIATLLMCIALLRSRAVPRWMPLLFGVGMLLVLAAPPGPIGAVFGLPLAIALLALATRIASPAQPSVAESEATSAA